MAMRIGIGQYYPHPSFLHRLDPRVKAGCALAVMLVIFFIRTPLQLLYVYALAFALIAASRIPAKKVVESIKPLVLILIFLGIFNLFFVRAGVSILSLGPIEITSVGLWDAVLYPLRFSIAILAGALLLLTTTPTELTDAFDGVLAPLSRLGLPGHELAMVFSLMLRFIPTIADEASAIIDAQRARGGGWDSGSFSRRIHGIGPVIIALLASSVRHAHNVGRALDARCYEGGHGRTQWHPLHMEKKDWAALAICAAALVGLFLVGLI
ncbi:MAG: energy-coupling factor transporter transmembrane component T family protein [Atopobiaceae bacterium]